MKRVLLSLMLIVLVIGIAVAGCAKPAPTPAPTPAPAPPKTLDIGVASVLTGPAAALGTAIQNAILLTIDDQNNQGGITIAGQKYMLNPIIRDTKFSVIVGKSIAEELIFDKGVKVIAGPCLADAVGVQYVSEKNKVIMFALDASLSEICTPDKPYSFFNVVHPLQLTAPGAAYTEKFYPEAKTVITMGPDTPSLPLWIDAAKTMCQRHDLDWLGSEKFSMETKDFMPVIARVLPKKPDIIDLAGSGTMGATGCLLVKQLREAGFNGILWSPSALPISVMMEVIPEEYRTKLISNDVIVESPIVSQAYKDMDQRYTKKFGEPTRALVGEFYNMVKPLFEFLNGQDNMDTTVWMQGFEKYHWQSIWGTESFWVGETLHGINRGLLRPFWVTEWIDGEPETRWDAPIPLDLFIEEE